jgi:hypothetical protein
MKKITVIAFFLHLISSIADGQVRTILAGQLKNLNWFWN